jgi:hypothetical protein
MNDGNVGFHRGKSCGPRGIVFMAADLGYRLIVTQGAWPIS